MDTEKDTIILSADTSSSKFSIALLKEDKLIDEIGSQSLNRHSSDLIPAIDMLLSKNSYKIDDVDGLCVGLGPGSFTGLRVGITTMRGLALVLNKPLVGVASIDAVAYNLCGNKGCICPIIDAKQKRVYARFYSSGRNGLRPKTGFLLLGIKELLRKVKGQTLFSGDAVGLYRDQIIKEKGGLAHFAPEVMWYPKAAIIGKLGMSRLRQKKGDNIYTLSPIYIYPKECQVRK